MRLVDWHPGHSAGSFGLALWGGPVPRAVPSRRARLASRDPDQTPERDARPSGTVHPVAHGSSSPVLRAAAPKGIRMSLPLWELSDRADPRVVPLADRHYNRQHVGSPQYAPPGRCLVLRRSDAFWITSWPYAEWTKHEWAGAWVCSAFRNEGDHLSSDLIRHAVAATVWRWPAIPSLGMVTFVNREKVRPKRDPGRCFLRAGFELAGATKGGLIALLLAPDAMPAPLAPWGAQESLLESPAA